MINAFVVSTNSRTSSCISDDGGVDGVSSLGIGDDFGLDVFFFFLGSFSSCRHAGMYAEALQLLSLLYSGCME